MRHRRRLTTRAVLLLLLTFGFFLLFCAGLPIAWILQQRLHWRDRVMHWWAKSVLRALHVRVRCRGPVPVGGCLLVANHLSYLDVLVLASTRPLSFLSKSEVARWPVLGPMARIAGVRFITREDKRDLPRVRSELASELANGHGVTFFPEGTSSGGDEVLPFRPALLADAATDQRPVHWAALAYATPAGSAPARESVCWWGEMEFVPHLASLLQLPFVDAVVAYGDAPITASDRKELARQLHKAIAAHRALLCSHDGQAS